MIKQKALIREIILITTMMVAVFFISINDIDESNGIKIYGDEIGYWENAALLTGRDWSGEASLNVYYGYGYGFLLTPLFFLFNESSAVMMHAAIILQGIMLSSCILATWQIIKKVNVHISWKCKAIITLFPVLYTSFVFYVKFTLSETIIVTCIWWISYLALCYVESKKTIQGIGIILLSCYMFSIHQRMIVMVITGVILVLLVSVTGIKDDKTKMLKRILILILITSVFLYICKSYDSFYTNNVYKSAIDGGKETNRVDVAAKQAIASFVSLSGFVSILLSLCGKLFYSFLGTYGFVLIGIYSCICYSIKYVKTKENFNKTVWYMYILINYLVAICTSSIVTRDGFETRSDLLLYGRYSEYTYGPILLAAVMYLYQVNKNKSKKLFIAMVIILVLCLLCLQNTYDDAPNSHFWAMCSALADIRALSSISNKDLLLVAALRCTFIVCFLFSILNFSEKVRKKLLNILLMTVVIFWIHVANINWEKNVTTWYIPMQNAMNDITTNMETSELFIVMDASEGGYMQFSLPNVPLKVCTDIEQVTKYPKGTFVITDIHSEYATYIRENFKVDKENDRYMRWIYD